MGDTDKAMTTTVFKSESQPDWGMGLVVEDGAAGALFHPSDDLCLPSLGFNVITKQLMAELEIIIYGKLKNCQCSFSSLAHAIIIDKNTDVSKIDQSNEFARGFGQPRKRLSRLRKSPQAPRT